MSDRRLVIAGTGSGVGKTTLTIGIMAALQKKGYTVQGFKCGPDYIDPTYHTAVTGRTSRNLDSWMFEHNIVREILNKASIGADISIIEGVMGFFDGKNPLSNTGSTAEISMITESPVLLIVNCASMARSAAAIVKGFQAFSTGPNIIGVIANQVGSEGHYKIVKAAIEQECDVPVMGYMKRELDIDIPSRHLGLIPAIERGELEPFFDKLAHLVMETIDIEQLYLLAKTSTISSGNSGIFQSSSKKDVCIAVAKDAAFNFYYQENLELLEANGANIKYFSPLKGDEVPLDADGLYLGGGFPEEFADELSRNEIAIKSIRNAIAKGLPTLAECGGFMFLSKSIETTSGEKYPMAGLIPGRIKMQKKLAALGYREITGIESNFLIKDCDQAKGHEFHYSTFEPDNVLPYAYEAKGRFGSKKEGCIIGNLVAGYTHFHFASNPKLVENWINACLKQKKLMGQETYQQ
ncbi:cobyrinic acid a,c-diamide synthase [Peribacillus butanolivorans]|uniref:Cobyrinate a,c-diamide synthase n=1 Tax=Peribacillus butanolivorans TaxID=421767 RepID=A0AAX0SBK8_9BACI|nr:cobyrinate a,c-diamide synthase [Peribacillus butanolivorans]AXN41135.1 cobyrinate a,c-diamide synthase [Peribacillus butanolivorans]PEJ37655.1 cobyrinic acid a,c-diamide synthase [Peribacillus butanolivorans]